MKSGRVKGGSIIPATIDTGRRKRSSMAQPIRNMAGSPRGVMGGAAQNIIEITSDDLVQNGGQYKLMGGPAIPMQIVTGRRSKQGAATVVYPVDILGNYDPTFAGYIYKLRQIESANLVGLWAQNELTGGVSIDYSGNDYHGAYTAVNLGQPGVPGFGMSAAGYDGATSFNNIYSAGFANDNALLNPGFETAGGGGADIWASWSEQAGAGALTNEVVIVHEGNDACKATFVAGSAFVFQNIVVIPGERRRLRFWTRGDGAVGGRYQITDVTNGADIQPLVGTGVTAAAWEMLVREYTVPAGCVLVREFLYSPSGAGDAYFDACEDRSMDGFLGDQGTILIHAQVANVGVWTDGTTRQIVGLAVDAANLILVRRIAANNTIQFIYKSGNVTEFQETAGLTSVDYLCYGISWSKSGDFVRWYIDGIASGAPDNCGGTWIGDIAAASAVVGATTTVPADVWSGTIGPVALWNTALTPAQMADASVQ